MGLPCYVPGCEDDAANTEDKSRIVFKAPYSSVHRWIKYLPKNEKPFTPKTYGVCSKHFEDRFIVKEEVVSVGGVKQTFKNDPWELTDDAVPTVFGETIMPLSVESNHVEMFSPKQEEPDFDDMTSFDDLIRFGSVNGDDDELSTTKRKAAAKPGPSSKKLKTEQVWPNSPPHGDGDDSSAELLTSNRPAHLKREIVPPSRIRDSIEDEDFNFEDVAMSPDSPPSPKRGGARGGKRRGRPRGSGSNRGNKRGGANTPKRAEQIKVKITQVTPGPSDAKPINGCFIEFCDAPSSISLFKMPQMTNAKLKDWMRYIPAAALKNRKFDPKIHYLCEEHFDKKFVMNTPKGKILTGDAIPSIFPNYPKQAFYNLNQAEKASRMVPIQPKTNRKQKLDPKGSRVEVVDGYVIEYEDHGISPEPITVTIDDDDDDTISKALPVKKPGPASKTKVGAKILDISESGYSLQYIYDMKERIQLPQAELWMFRMMVDKETKARCIFICEIVARLERLMVRRGIKIRQDLTFKVEANGSDFTQMFNESGSRVDSLYKLQEMILDLSAFKVCDGWAQFESLEASSVGRKIEGIWFAHNCEGLNLNNNRCRPCMTLKLALMAKKSGLSLNSNDPSVIAQIKKLPKDDPLFLQHQIQDLLKEKTKLKYELSTVEKRESRLQDRIKMMEAGMKVKGKTVYVTATPDNATMTSVQTAAPAVNSVVTGPGKPSLSVAPSSTATAFQPRQQTSRMVRPRATTSSSTTFSVTTKPASPVRKQTPIIVSPTPLYPMGVQNHTIPRHPHPLVQYQQTNISTGAYYAPTTLTPTFVLAQGSGTEIGHQAIESTQIIPGINIGSTTLPGVNVTLQKTGGQDSGSGSAEEITLLSL